MHWNTILAQASTPATAAAGTPATPGATAPAPSIPLLFNNPIIFLVLIGVMMYFLLFRPQQQQRKQQARLLSNLKSGDKVVTSSGIIGVVITVKEKTVSLRSVDAKMEVLKSSVTEILESGDDNSSSS